MSFGFQRQPRVFLHDTAVLTAYVHEDDEETFVPQTDIAGVTFSIRRPEDNDRAAFLIHDLIRIEATDPGAFGNAYTVAFINPGSAGALSAVLTGFNLVVTLAHNGTALTSTVGDVIELLQGDVTIYPFLTAAHSKSVPAADQLDLLATPLASTNLSHGEGPILYRVTGTVSDDGTAKYVVPESITTVPGAYLGMARFTLTDGQIKSIPVDFDVIDPFEDIGDNPADGAINVAWDKLQDCFDSELGGPWLRDMTMARWDKSTFRNFVSEALFEINNQLPQTEYSETSYPYGGIDGSDALLAQGILVSAIRHLMRSYTEQPDVSNSPVGFLDRKRYQQAWKAIYDIEYAVFMRWLALYKRRLYNLGSTRVLISNKAGRLYGAAIRTRNAGRGGYW